MLRYETMFRAAIDVALKAGKLLIDIQSEAIEIKRAGKDFLSEGDLASEKLILDGLKSFNNVAVLSEEVGGQFSAIKGLQWIIDPLDATINYGHNDEFWGLSIALAIDGKSEFGIVYLPKLNKLFKAYAGHGTYLNHKKITVSQDQNFLRSRIFVDFPTNTESRGRGIKIFKEISDRTLYPQIKGCSIGGLVSVASGMAHGYIHTGPMPYDIAAGGLIVEEAGGIVSDMCGLGWNPFSPHILCACNKSFHQELLRCTAD